MFLVECFYIFRFLQKQLEIAIYINVCKILALKMQAHMSGL